MGLYYPEPSFVALPAFKSFLDGERPMAFEQNMRLLMRERRLFFMEKDTAPQTSLEARALDATLSIEPRAIKAHPGESVRVTVEVRNTGTALWRPSDWPAGPVRLGPSLIDQYGERRYLPRWELPNFSRSGVMPGTDVSIVGEVTAPSTPGEYEFNVQLVSESVAWFGQEARVSLSIAES
jgi:hypothetical protein